MFIIKKCLPLAITVALALPMQLNAEEMALDTHIKKYSYLLGLRVGALLEKEGSDLDMAALLEGIKDIKTGKNIRLNEEEMKSVLINKRKLDAEKKALAGKENLAKGKAFLAKNKTAEGVVTLASGLQYKIIKKGDGTVLPTKSDKVTVHYEGKLLDGTVFDSSIKRNKPAQFPLNGVIAGFSEALSLMTTGAKWQVYIPADLAYGNRAVGSKIGANSTLIFDLELISIDSPKTATPKASNKALKPSDLDAMKEQFRAKLAAAKKEAMTNIANQSANKITEKATATASVDSFKEAIKAQANQ